MLLHLFEQNDYEVCHDEARERISFCGSTDSNECSAHPADGKKKKKRKWRRDVPRLSKVAEVNPLAGAGSDAASGPR